MPVAAGPTGHGASHELRDAVTSGYALRHSARQSGRTGIGRSVPACVCLSPHRWLLLLSVTQ
jgi:hypothetical protein